MTVSASSLFSWNAWESMQTRQWLVHTGRREDPERQAAQLGQYSGMSPEAHRIIAPYTRGKRVPILACGPESRMVLEDGSLVRLGVLRLSVLVLAVAALSGCGSEERALKLSEVKDAVQAAGLKDDLRIVTQQGGWRDVRANDLPIVGPTNPDGPDYVQSMVEPALLVVRFGRLAQARHAAKVYSQRTVRAADGIRAGLQRHGDELRARVPSAALLRCSNSARDPETLHLT